MTGVIVKWLFKGLLMSLVMSSIMSYLFYIQTGRTPWSLLGIHSVADLKPDLSPGASIENLADTVSREARQLADKAGDLVPSAPAQPTQVYRWVDAQGVTHFSETPPAGVDAVAITVDPNQNVIQGLPTESADPVPTQSLDQLKQQLQQQQDAKRALLEEH
ncbi:DUF4124 domain-containing protein [Simiduia agarivorans]|uniref:DUF4124 domain-containing protein n=1 Tax=Simiduia agarivorans (strain DSM 21679 / JCM 13881 / BCRC 17597 / SA1) TaxID=1117647 RepID=K4L3I2_SIMAS|nr:DUF4124 domain-containing protein [Simiduia agarivorans]AFV00743.1 hypothetical protein M5M_18070 [Simiduia agarivorans SA1 = DSM 21679]